MDPTSFQTSQYPESNNSSPRSRNAAEAWDNEPYAAVGGGKMRLMCSYGGHIIPRPHDKSLCYVGGETRIVVVDRGSSLSELHSRLSHTLLNGRHFTLKYQLPTEELDSLISVSTEEDLENMIEEYDRTASSSPLRPSRLRLFLFLSKPETAASMGCLLADAKSETWFVDALNNAGLLSRGLSDSAAEANNIVELDRFPNPDSDHSNSHNNNMIKNSAPDSPVAVEINASSFESSVSSPSMANLPPIKVRADGANNVFALEEQFSQIHLANNGAIPAPAVIGINNAAVAAAAATHGDDEKSDHGIRKPPLPLQLGPRKTSDSHGLSSPDSRNPGGFSLPSPDSVTSDSSITSAASFSKQTNQDSAHQAMIRENRGHPAVIDPKNMDPSSIIQMQQGQDPAAIPPPQFIHANTQYYQHPNSGTIPISSYYPMYAQQQVPQQPVPQQMDQQYPMYLLPVSQAQSYSFAAQSRPPNQPYKEALPPVYPTKPAAPSRPVQVPSNQFQNQFYGLSQVPPPSASIAPPSASSVAPNYGYDYSQYYTQHPVAPIPSQYQTMTPTTAVLLSQASSQIAAENAAQQAQASQQQQ